jgi:AcrR family transcriptional regulator
MSNNLSVISGRGRHKEKERIMRKDAKKARVTGPRRRLPSEERRRSILVAARKVFSESGDPTGTTMKSIASAAGISEGIIYHHFESKEQLYFESIVQPLTDAIAAYVEEAAHLDRIPSGEAADAMRHLFWRNIIQSLQSIVPLLGLVLFGEPKQARQFYRTNFTEAVDALADRWQRLFGQRGSGHPSREVALSVLGMTMMFAIDARFNKDFDLDQAVESLTQITRYGFWPEVIEKPSANSRSRSTAKAAAKK